MEAANILIVDDEQVICNGCRMALMDENYSVDIRMDGRSGLDAILNGGYDVVLLDMKLPDLDGMEILKTVGKEKPAEQIIVMTGHFSVQNAVDAMKSGAFDYLTKPFSDDELSIAVKKALENKRLKEENLYLRQQLAQRFDYRNIIGENQKILNIFEGIDKVAPTDSTVLLCGESGTGKELFARAIHARSRRAAARFMPIDCSTFSSSLLESELFGHVKGAFTGAVKDKEGIFEMANHGSLFLDEVANLDLATQARLLRALETHEYMPVGGNRFRKADVRIIGATNRDLKSMVADGKFREDFFYRLNVFPLLIPPLRERRDDIPKLLYHFLKIYCQQMEKRIDGFSDDALAFLINHDWPGNVRQLKNLVERLVIMADDGSLGCETIAYQLDSDRIRPPHAIPETLDELKRAKQEMLEKEFGQIERAFLRRALSSTDGNITQAAKRVGMQRSNFSALMKKHRLSADVAKKI
ncbi:sigma-54 interaction domain protein [delta proteobacterium NaphS2]|nr:sigma-54 interaction domain protein [delta proteobacterium NaphS2]